MQPIIYDNLKAIATACEEHGVKVLYVFGSAVRDDFSADSDIDLLADFLKPSNPDDLKQLSAYYQNMEQLEEKLRNIFTRDVDLIQERGIKNNYLRRLIDDEKNLVYAAA